MIPEYVIYFWRRQTTGVDTLPEITLRVLPLRLAVGLARNTYGQVGVLNGDIAGISNSNSCGYGVIRPR